MQRIVPSATFFALLGTLLVYGGVNADIYVCQAPEGTVQFTNVPARSGCRPLVRDWTRGSSSSTQSTAGFDDIIRSASSRHGVDPHLVRAVIKAESDFNSQARSHKGAQGLMQLMPDTARLHNVGNVYDPHENVDGGVRHLRMLLDRYAGDLKLTLAAYNAGIKAVEQYRGVPPFSETREYIRRVLDYHQRYRGNGKVSITQTKQ